jgi:hypothetical protein
MEISATEQQAIVRNCNTLYILVLVELRLWVRILHYEGQFWNYNYYSILFLIDTLHYHFFSCFYEVSC